MSAVLVVAVLLVGGFALLRARSRRRGDRDGGRPIVVLGGVGFVVVLIAVLAFALVRR